MYHSISTQLRSCCMLLLLIDNARLELRSTLIVVRKEDNSRSEAAVAVAARQLISCRKKRSS